MSKKILLAGATGMIGKRLIHSLKSRGDEIFLLTRDVISARSIFPDAKKVIHWDDIGSLRSEKINGIINLAGMNMGAKRWNGKVKKQLYYSRIHTTRKIVELINSMISKPEVLINASGVDYYGDTGDMDIYEDSLPGTSFAAKLTVDWESEASRAIHYGARVVYVRTGVVLSEDSPALRKMILPFKFFIGGYPGSGKQYFSWIHINDIINVYIYVLDNSNVSGAVNAVSPNSLTMKDFCSELGKVLHRPSYFPAPALLLKLVFGEMSELVLSGRKAIPKKLLDSGFEFHFTKVSEALQIVI